MSNALRITVGRSVGLKSCADRRRVVRHGLGPPASRPTQHPAQQPLVGPRFQKPRAVAAPRHVDDADALRLGLFWCLARQIGGRARHPRRAQVADRADAAGGAARRADRGPQIHHRLRMTSGPMVRRQPRREGPQRRFRSRQRIVQVEQPCHDPFHVPVHHHCRGHAAAADAAHRLQLEFALAATGRLQQLQLPRQLVVQPHRPLQVAGRAHADLDVVAPGRLQPEIMVEGDHFVDPRHADPQLLRQLARHSAGHVAEFVLDRMQDHDQVALLAFPLPGQLAHPVAHPLDPVE